jgi:hypothetical protein
MDLAECKTAILETAAIDRDWLRDHHWCAIPVAGPLVSMSPFVDAIVAAGIHFGVQYLYHFEIELATPGHQVTECMVSALRSFLNGVRLGDAIIADGCKFMVLCPPREFFIIAGEIDVVERMLQQPAIQALEEFRVFAADPANSFYDSPGFRYYPFVYDYYKATLDALSATG